MRGPWHLPFLVAPGTVCGTKSQERNTAPSREHLSIRKRSESAAVTGAFSVCALSSGRCRRGAAAGAEGKQASQQLCSESDDSCLGAQFPDRTSADEFAITRVVTGYVECAWYEPQLRALNDARGATAPLSLGAARVLSAVKNVAQTLLLSPDGGPIQRPFACARAVAYEKAAGERNHYGRLRAQTEPCG
ncbi:hypothetical protein HPB50_010656 [Hyalomma asiaticum]|uniref:Uncharacterized protein n=1 Tax=Hyalomma asiaticum TaxID=266040 RepID=A0ACB7TIG6_HYAAI|nr:hypothetical protein HPB50_010656 [Hyalomma asiaticum]